MEAEGPITRNLCTDVKQLERSQGPDSAVPVSHGSYSQSKVRTIPLFCLGPRSACVLVSYISRQAWYWFLQCREEAVVCQRGPLHPPLSVYWENRGSIIHSGGAFSIKQGQIGSVEALRCLLPPGKFVREVILIKAGVIILHSITDYQSERI